MKYSKAFRLVSTIIAFSLFFQVTFGILPPDIEINIPLPKISSFKKIASLKIPNPFLKKAQASYFCGPKYYLDSKDKTEKDRGGCNTGNSYREEGSKVNTSNGNLVINNSSSGVPAPGGGVQLISTYSSRNESTAIPIQAEFSTAASDVTWKVEIAGKTHEGAGKVAEVTWDTKDQGGNPVPAGTYTYTVTAKATYSTNVVLTKTTSGTVEVRRGFEGIVGYNWFSNYEMGLKEEADGTVTRTTATGTWRVFLENPDGTYKSEAADYSNLTKNPASTFTLKEKDGTKYNFSSSGKLTSIQDRNGNTQTLTYTEGKLTQIIDSSGRTTTLSYGPNGKVSTVTDPSGRVTTYEQNPDGTLKGITDLQGNTTSYEYDPSTKNLISQTDPKGNKTTYEYNDDRLVKVTRPDGGSTTSNYDPTTDTSTFTNERGAKTKYTYNEWGNVIRVEDALGNVTTYERDSNQNVTAITDPKGRRTTFAYDSKGNLTTTTDPLGNKTTYTYELNFNQATSVTDAKGNKTTFRYGNKGNLISTTNALGHKTGVEYNSQGLPLKIINAEGRAVTSTYDNYGNLVEIQQPLGNISKIGYDASGNPTKTLDDNGKETNFQYNQVGNLTTVVDANGRVSLGKYDANGNLTSVTDPNGNSTKYAYDSQDRVSQETDPLGNASSLIYDGQGNLIQTSDANGKTTYYTYDLLDRLTEAIYPDGTKETFAYDEVGNQIKAESPSDTLTFDYDALGYILSQTNSLGAIRYSYDSLGNRISMTDPQGNVTKYTYDALSRVTSITDPNNNTTQYTYDSLNRRTKVTRPNNTLTTYQYDAASRLLALTNRKGEEIISSYNYTYDKVGNRTLMTEKDGSKTFYQYDNLYRLTSVRYPDGNTESYTYDPSGNRFTKTNSQETINYTYNRVNQLLQAGDTTYTYDKNGNLIAKNEPSGTTTYTYNPKDEIVEITFADGKTNEFKYDSLGRRISLTKKDGQVTSFLYDGEDILQEQTPAKDIIARYAQGPGIDEPISITQRGTNSYYHFDGLGSVTALTDESGNQTASYKYDAWGNILTKTASTNNSYTYTSRESDEEAGLYYYRARYYDPSVGRFLGKDPYSGAMSSPQSFNLYAYVENNPVNLVDPSGLAADVVVDIAFIVYDIYELSKNPCDPWKWVALGVDIVLAIVPFATGGGAAVRGARAANRADDLYDTARMANKIDDYKDVAKLTKGLKGGEQAHHILEARHLRNWGRADEVAKAPAVKLSKAEHAKLTNALREALPFGKKYTKEEVRKAYQKVYRDYPQYLKAIERYFK